MTGKKALPFILAFLGIAVCGGALKAQTLDEAILNTALVIGRDLPAGATVALVSFRSQSGRLNDYAVNELYGALLRNGKVTPVKPDQSQFQNIRDELRPYTSSELNAESARAIGRLMGAQYFVTGSLEIFNLRCSIKFTVVDTDVKVKTGYTAPLDLNSDSQLASLLVGTVTRIQPPNPKLWTVGASVGLDPFCWSSWLYDKDNAPLYIGTVHGTLAPFKDSFLELGIDIGGGMWHFRLDDIQYFSLYPFANYAFFLPYDSGNGKDGGFYAGAGIGVMCANYTFKTEILENTFQTEGPIWENTFAVNFVIGVNMFDMFDFSYTLRTDFKTGTNSKLSVGYVYRFKQRAGNR
jgi:hypothetical protein